MINDTHDFEEQEAPADTFTVRGHVVTLLSPVTARITIRCPFPRTNAPTLEQKQFVMGHTQSVVNYLVQEGILSPMGGVGIMVLTVHPETL